MTDLRIEWVLTNYCNFQCNYCPDYLHDGKYPCPTLDSLIIACNNIIKQSYKFNFQSTLIQFNGGEPSTCESLKHLLQIDLDKILKFKLVSNASADYDWWKSVKDKIYSLDLTYHLECDLDHFQNIASFFIEHGTEVFIRVPMPVEQDKWLHAYMAYKNLQKISNNVHMKMLYSNFSKGSNKYLTYTDAQWDIYFRINGLEYNKEIPMGSEEYKKINKLNDFYGTLCWAGVEQAVITYFGDVFRGWCMSNTPLGNVYNNTFELHPVPLPCPKVQCGNGFDRAARKSVKSWGMT